MKPKLSNADLRARLVHKWKTKAKYHFKRFICSAKGISCFDCKDSFACNKFRRAKWIEWNFN